jgi:hypothetical protein
VARREGLNVIRRRALVVAVLFFSLDAVAQEAAQYLNLDGGWYALPYNTIWFEYSNASGYPTIYLTTAEFTLCAPKTGTDSFGTNFIFYGPMSYPIYQWQSLSWATIAGVGDVVTIETENGTIACTGEIPSPLEGADPTDRVFADGFEITGMSYIAGDTIFLDGFSGDLMPKK